MKCLFIFFAVIGILWAIWYSWFGRYTTNTAGGRFYKNDRWTGETLVVEKDGYTHLLAQSSCCRKPFDGQDTTGTNITTPQNKRKPRRSSFTKTPLMAED